MHGKIFVINDDEVDEDYLFDIKENNLIDCISKSDTYDDDIACLAQKSSFIVDSLGYLTFDGAAIERFITYNYTKLCMFIQTDLSNPVDFAYDLWKVQSVVNDWYGYKFYYEGCMYTELEFLLFIYRRIVEHKPCDEMRITQTFDYHY